MFSQILFSRYSVLNWSPGQGELLAVLSASQRTAAKHKWHAAWFEKQFRDWIMHWLVTDVVTILG